MRPKKTRRASPRRRRSRGEGGPVLRKRDANAQAMVRAKDETIAAW
jgi:hypothetical protein